MHHLIQTQRTLTGCQIYFSTDVLNETCRSFVVRFFFDVFYFFHLWPATQSKIAHGYFVEITFRNSRQLKRYIHITSDKSRSTRVYGDHCIAVTLGDENTVFARCEISNQSLIIGITRTR